MPWREQIMSVKVADIYAMAFVGGGLLIEPVPITATHAAHNFLPSFCRNHKASCTTPEQATVLPLGIV
jgi:hypothetical protein